MKKILLFLFISQISGFISQVSIAQNNHVDSLTTLLKTNKEDTNKVKNLYTLCNEYFLTGEYAKGLDFGKQAT